MGKRMSAEWYDAGLRIQTVQHYAEDKYAIRNQELLEFFIKNMNNFQASPKRVIEVAAGCWHFAKLLLERVPKIELYDLSDFAEIVVSDSTEVLKTFTNTHIWCWDVDQNYANFDWTRFDTFVCMSLEHLENDIQILEQLPSGMFIFLSLPTFDSEGHIRWFCKEEDVRFRYENVISIKEIKLCVETKWLIAARKETLC